MKGIVGTYRLCEGATERMWPHFCMFPSSLVIVHSREICFTFTSLTNSQTAVKNVLISNELRIDGQSDLDNESLFVGPGC